MVSADVVALLLLIGGRSPQPSPADNGTSIQLLHVPPGSDVPPASAAVPPVSCVPPVSAVPSISGIPPLPEKHPTMQWCGTFDMSVNSPLTRYPPGVQWVLITNSTDAAKFEGRAVVGGYEEQGSPLWVIRACYDGQLAPGKYSTKRNAASVSYSDKGFPVYEFEVLLSQPGRVSWIADEGGHFPANAIPAGRIQNGETMYIGRAKHEGFIINGKVAPSHGVLYSSFNGRATRHKKYEVLIAD